MIGCIEIGGRLVGPGHPCFVIAEIGINHGGDVSIAKRLIAVAAAAGCDAVKFQKRTVDVVYSAEELARPRESPFGDTNGDLKRGLELSEAAYREIDECCRMHSILWSASCWDEASLEFILAFKPAFLKIASASLTDDGLLRKHRESGLPVILSTGGSTLEQIDRAVEVLGRDRLALLHCNSTYPAPVSELNLRCIATLRQRYGGMIPVGYSGHETGLSPSLVAATLGACIVERHITLDRASWGSDQAASMEPQGITRLVRDIRTMEAALGDGVKRVYPAEVGIMKKLRRIG